MFDSKWYYWAVFIFLIGFIVGLWKMLSANVMTNPTENTQGFWIAIISLVLILVICFLGLLKLERKAEENA
jgi:DMSO/TMAO reductase YedYZ heme-binding membrane subunit